MGEDTWGVEYSEIEVDLEALAAKDIAHIREQIAAKLQETPGFSFMVLPYLSERIMETLTGHTAAVSIKVYGDDLTKLDDIARQIERILMSVPGNDGVRADVQTGVPELVIRVRPDAAARFGLRKTEILDAIHAAYQGAKVGQVYEGNRIINVVVILDPQQRQDPATVGKLWLAVAPGTNRQVQNESSTDTIGDTLPGAENTEQRIQLRQVADIFLSDGRRLIAHEGGLRRQVVTCNVWGRDVESFVAESEAKLNEIELPERYALMVEGEHLAKQTAQQELLLLGSAVGIGVVMLLWLAFRAVRPLVLVLTNLPFAFVGGVAAVTLGGGVLNVGSLIGFVTLFGITVRNGIMMISHWQHLHDQEGLPWGPELVFRGAQERLVPVLMTALVTGLGLLPIAIGSGEAGREVEGPMAWVILGGLITSTVLNLVVLPVLYLRWGHAGDSPAPAHLR